MFLMSPDQLQIYTLVLHCCLINERVYVDIHGSYPEEFGYSYCAPPLLHKMSIRHKSLRMLTTDCNQLSKEYARPAGNHYKLCKSHQIQLGLLVAELAHAVSAVGTTATTAADTSAAGPTDWLQTGYPGAFVGPLHDKLA